MSQQGIRSHLISLRVALLLFTLYLLAGGLTPVPVPAAEATYVGAEECGRCHTIELQGWKKTPHARAESYGAAQGEVDRVVGCETCHGPGSAHVESMDAADIKALGLSSSAQQLAVCGFCHGEGKAGERLEYEEFLESAHYKKASMACTSCHTAHGVNKKGVQLHADFEKLCAKCHPGQTFDLDRAMPKRTDKTGAVIRDHSFLKAQ